MPKLLHLRGTSFVFDDFTELAVPPEEIAIDYRPRDKERPDRYVLFPAGTHPDAGTAVTLPVGATREDCEHALAVLAGRGRPVPPAAETLAPDLPTPERVHRFPNEG